MSSVAMQVDSAHDFSWKSKSAPRYKFRKVVNDASSDPTVSTSSLELSYRFGRSWVVNLAKSRFQCTITLPVQASDYSNAICAAPFFTGYSLQTETGVMLQQVDTYAQGIYKALMPTSFQRDEFVNYPGKDEPMSGMVSGNSLVATNQQITSAGAGTNAAVDYIQHRSLIQTESKNTALTLDIDCPFEDLFPPSVLTVPVDHYPGMDYVVRLTVAPIGEWAFKSQALTGSLTPTALALTDGKFVNKPVLQIACLDDAAQALAIKELCLTQGIQIPCPRIFVDVQSALTASTLFTRQYKFNISHGQRLLRVATFPFAVRTLDSGLRYTAYNVSSALWSEFRDYLGQIPLMDSSLSPAEVHNQLIKPLFEKTLHGKRNIWNQDASIVRDFTGGWELRKGCPAAGVDLSLPLDYQVEMTKTTAAESVLVVWLGQNVFRVNPTGITLLPA